MLVLGKTTRRVLEINHETNVTTVCVSHKVYNRSCILISHYLRENQMRYCDACTVAVLTCILQVSGSDALIVSRSESTCLAYHRILQQKGVCSRDGYGITDECACLLDKIKCYPHSKCTRNQFLRDQVFCDMPLNMEPSTTTVPSSTITTMQWKTQRMFWLGYSSYFCPLACWLT